MQNLVASETPSSAPEDDEIGEAVGRTFDRAFARLGVNPKTLSTTFEATLEGLKKARDPELKLRSIAKSAALSTGRCHGNVMDTGRCLLEKIEELSTKHGLRVELARDQVLLGLAEGACQLGPVVYCRFLDVAASYKEGADDWIARNRRLPAIFDGRQLPVIVPYEVELQIDSPSLTLEPDSLPAPSGLTEEPAAQWSRPAQRNIFRRLTEAVGHFFGG